MLLVTELESTDALGRIEEVAAARGARVAVVTTARSADRDDAFLLQCAGYVVTTYFCEYCCWTGAGDRDRTCDILFTREVLYQLSYTGEGALMLVSAPA